MRSVDQTFGQGRLLPVHRSLLRSIARVLLLERPVIAGRPTEVLCFVSFSRKFVLGANGYDLPPGLQENKRVFGDVNGDYRLTNDDILTLEQEIVNHRDHGPYPYNWGFDLDSNGVIDGEDMRALMEQGFKTSRADIVNEDRELGPNGFTSVLEEGFLIVGNLGMEDATLADGDLNLDGVVDVLGDSLLLVPELNKVTLIRLDLDFDSTGDSEGVLDAADIDALVAHMVVDPDIPPVYDQAFDLTTGTVEADGTIVLNEELDGIADGVVNRADLIFYLEEVLGTVLGDTNLDGVVDILGDFNSVNSNVANGVGSGWSGGDLDFDGDVDGDDLVILGQIVLGTNGS